MKSCLPRLFEYDPTSTLQVLDACSDVGVSRSLRRSAVALKVHGPDIEAIAGKLIHQGIVPVAGNTKIEGRPRRNRRAVGKKQNRTLAWVGPRGGRSLPAQIQRDV